MSERKQKLITFLFGVVLTIIVCFFYVKPILEKQYAFVSVERVIENIYRQAGKRQNGGVEMIEFVNKAKLIFGREVKRYSKDNNTVVISSLKVIAGAEDITEEISDRVLKGLGL